MFIPRHGSASIVVASWNVWKLAWENWKNGLICREKGTWLYVYHTYWLWYLHSVHLAHTLDQPFGLTLHQENSRILFPEMLTTWTGCKPPWAPTDSCGWLTWSKFFTVQALSRHLPKLGIIGGRGFSAVSTSEMWIYKDIRGDASTSRTIIRTRGTGSRAFDFLDTLLSNCHLQMFCPSWLASNARWMLLSPIFID